MTGPTESMPTIQEAVLASNGLSEPTADDVALMLDLRERIENYVLWAAEEWFKRYRASNPKLQHAQIGEVIDFDGSGATYEFAIDSAHAYDFDLTKVDIPIDQLLPAYAQISAVLEALGRS